MAWRCTLNHPLWFLRKTRLIGDKFTDMEISIERGTDRDYSTFFRMSYQPGIPEKGYWFGYDLGENNNYLITRVEFCPNSNQNMVEPGDFYELFYFKDQWISLGQQVATDNYLLYNNAPVGALFWLRNLSKGNGTIRFMHRLLETVASQLWLVVIRKS